jgi:hypothetical protein
MTGLATNDALAGVVNALLAQSDLFLGWGGGSGQDETDTDLASPFSESRASGMAVVATTNTTGDTYRLTGTITATTARVVTEVGAFAEATGSGLQLYGDFPALTLATGDSVAFTIDVVVDQA